MRNMGINCIRSVTSLFVSLKLPTALSMKNGFQKCALNSLRESTMLVDLEQIGLFLEGRSFMFSKQNGRILP